MQKNIAPPATVLKDDALVLKLYTRTFAFLLRQNNCCASSQDILDWDGQNIVFRYKHCASL